ncbi:hypothetical protein TYRP_015379 [Tyrophagus putrescentiae]|nr:hypothetical protein TYRP_015379 [Tyrophagus putrescentiae]
MCGNDAEGDGRSIPLVINSNAGRLAANKDGGVLVQARGVVVVVRPEEGGDGRQPGNLVAVFLYVHPADPGVCEANGPAAGSVAVRLHQSGTFLVSADPVADVVGGVGARDEAHKKKKTKNNFRTSNQEEKRQKQKLQDDQRTEEDDGTATLSAFLFLVGTFLLLQPHFSHSLPLLESSPSNEEAEDKSEKVQQQQQSSTTDSPSPPEHPLLFSLPEYEEGGAQSSPCWNYLFGNSGPHQKKTKKGEKDQRLFTGHCVREAQNAHHLPSLIYDAREYEPVRVAFCAAMYQAVGCFRRVLCTICGDLHTRYQKVFDSQNSDNLFLSENQEGENLQLFAWNGTAYEQAMIEALEEKVPFCAGELPSLDRNFLSDVEEGVAAGVSEMESPLARLNVVFDALGQAPARFTPTGNESTTAYVTPTSTYVMIVCFVLASAAFVGRHCLADDEAQ